MDGNDQPLLVAKTEAARLLSLSTKTLDRLVRRGEIDAIHIGRAIRFSPSDLRKFVEHQKREAPVMG